MAARRPSTLVCDVATLAPDAATLDALAHLQVAASRLGYELVLRGASARLLELVELFGLCELLPVEARREPEEREQRVGVEEERELDDPAL